MGISNIDSVNHECITQQINMVQALHSHLTPESISQQQCLHAWLRHEDRDPGSDWDDGDRIDSDAAMRGASGCVDLRSCISSTRFCADGMALCTASDTMSDMGVRSSL